jgi:hypothetical protein
MMLFSVLCYVTLRISFTRRSYFLVVKKINLVSALRKHKILEENTYDHTVTNVSEKINEACGIKNKMNANAHW